MSNYDYRTPKQLEPLLFPIFYMQIAAYLFANQVHGYHFVQSTVWTESMYNMIAIPYHSEFADQKLVVLGP